MSLRKFFSMILLISLLTGFAGSTQPAALAADPRALVAIPLQTEAVIQRFQSTGLPAYALLDSYILAGADSAGQLALAKSGLSFQVLDDEITSGYYLANRMPSAAKIDWSQYGRLLLDLGAQALLQTDARQAEALSLAGAELRYISLSPIVLPVDQSIEQVFPEEVTPDPIVQMVIDQIDQDTVSEYDRQLAGELPVWVDNDWYTITSRYTYSGESIQKATSYVGQDMAAEGMDVEYHVWGGNTYPNVIGQITGLINPDDIYIIGAHLDDVSGAPGADDNASGSVATMIAADLLSQYQWSCTIRFAYWTGEEQGLLGSEVYAQRSHQNGENIVGYLNLDMIAWNTINSDPGIDLLYNPSMPSTLQLAQLMSDVVDAYNLDLTPELVTSFGGGSDHSSFWDQGYTSILAIEDENDFNPYYHSAQDTPAHTDLAYFTDFTKAAIATFMHMSGCALINMGDLDGTVTESVGSTPLEGVEITAVSDDGYTHNATTDASGYYTTTALAGTYTVTAEAFGYYPAEVSGIVVITDMVTTQDFVLDPLPEYTISGTVTEIGSGIPLAAQVEVLGSPVVPALTNPATGVYSLTVPTGTYTLRVTSDGHQYQDREVVVNSDLNEDFSLEKLPCILLVDDDNNAPNTLPYYTSALDALHYTYDVFTVGTGAEDGPDLPTMQGYNMVIWFSGDKFGSKSAGPNSTDEANLVAYLDGGGKLFLDSQGYLDDMGVTSFGQSYLGVASKVNGAGDATSKYGVSGDPIGDGLGPYHLTYPSGFYDGGDIVYPADGASIAFRSAAGGGGNPLDLDKNGGDWQTVFFGTSWVPVYKYLPANGEAVLQRVVDFFGGCPCEAISGTSFTYQPQNPWVGGEVTFTGSALGSLPIVFDWDFGDGDLATGEVVTHTYGAEGDYTVAMTATNSCGLESVSQDLTLLNPPDISLYPLFFDVTLTTGESSNDSLLISNIGPLTLTFNIAEVPPVDWLAVDSLGGEVSPGDGLTTTLSFDAGVLPAGTYTTTLMINSNDPDEPQISLPVTLTVCTPVSDTDFSWTPASPFAGEVVTFTASVSGSQPVSYYWEFSDGITSTAESPARTFAPGVYTVTLTTSNACSVDMITYTITIAESPWRSILPLVSKK